MSGEQLEFSWILPSSGKAGRPPQKPQVKKRAKRAQQMEYGRKAYVPVQVRGLTQKDLDDRVGRSASW